MAKMLGKIEKEPVIKAATQADFIRMFYIILAQNGITPDKPMEIDAKALTMIPANAKICGEIEDGILKVWLPETRQQKRKKEREKSKLILPDKRLIVPQKERQGL